MKDLTDIKIADCVHRRLTCDDNNIAFLTCCKSGNIFPDNITAITSIDMKKDIYELCSGCELYKEDA